MRNKAAYDAIAAWYDALVRKGGLIQDLALPTIYELMGDVNGQRICDLACGHRILRPLGWFIFSITHPCLEISRAQSRWMVGPAGLREVNSYFVEGPWQSDNPDGVRGRVAVYHRTLSTYVNTLQQAGLTLKRLVEPRATSPIDGLDAGNPEFPIVLIIQCTKITLRQAP